MSSKDNKLPDNKNNQAAFSFINEPIIKLNGIGEKSQAGFNRLKIYTVKDIIFSFPYRYEVLIPDIHNEKSVLAGTFLNSGIVRTHRGKSIYKAVFKAHNGYFACLWVNFNASYPSSLLHTNSMYYMYGTVTKFENMPSIFHPEIINKEDIGKIRSIYTVPAGVTVTAYRKFLKEALDKGLKYVSETLPEYILDKYNYPDIKDAVKTLHYPETKENVESIINRKHPAYVRFIYEELFYLQLVMQLKRKTYTKGLGIKFNIDKEYLEEINQIMPFKLTKGQKKVLLDIFNDMVKNKQMNRLIQGDVGSGKTIIAFISTAVAVHNGYQAVILAPTEVLAEQHYNNAEKFFSKLKINVCLLTGSVTKKNKEIIKEKLVNGEIDIIIGTHALIEEDVEFKKLGFIIADEQHRFGVHQRKILIDKGYNPDILLMTATPIPRTLAMTLYGDLDVSVIDELPPGRIPCITKTYRASQITKAFDFVEEMLNDKKKAYFIYPLIDESDKLELKAATQSYEEVKKYFSDKKVGLLHGKMKPDEKRQLLHDFKYSDMDILVSTTVVEVGVDVPEATVILIENAERFGLSQLHQLRGRVGRNDIQSYCLLVASDKISEYGEKRIKAMLEYKDGFKLAEADLELRGQGDFFGTKQSGMPDLHFADIIKDIKIIQQVKNDVADILEEDADLSIKKNNILYNRLKEMYKDSTSYFGIG
ncbi:MAG: ATP-dependent DNA helicase RecG [Mucispirillum sp.]|nr:ATP-dependent DNA helicase RecG [Mucispirillum sp.]